jgi:hypothetical protein
MAGVALRLLALIALMLMPFGMQPAGAAEGNHQQIMSGMATSHCPDQSRNHQHTGLATCSMACASALPAQGLVREERPLLRQHLVVAMITPILHGTQPEIATPPPKYN